MRGRPEPERGRPCPPTPPVVPEMKIRVDHYFHFPSEYLTLVFKSDSGSKDFVVRLVTDPAPVDPALKAEADALAATLDTASKDLTAATEAADK